ncbi:MAG: flagellar basal body rod protein FlgC [Rhodospirillales bacterium]|nr:flagellar basal body rod protein FlgC [Rhodospirillales bacterium]
MAEDLFSSLRISAAGLKAQGTRLRIISQNIANANSLAKSPGGEPYRRQVITFKNALDRELGVETVRTGKIRTDPSQFSKKYEPSHPAADAQGYVQTPNVNVLIEMMDMRQAQRTYEANLNVMRASKQMMEGTIQLLR